jgi:hypothetical protein
LAVANQRVPSAVRVDVGLEAPPDSLERMPSAFPKTTVDLGFLTLADIGMRHSINGKCNAIADAKQAVTNADEDRSVAVLR